MRHALATITNSRYGFGGVSTWLERIGKYLPPHGWRVTAVTHALSENNLADWQTKHPDLIIKPIFGKFARVNDIERELEKYLDAEKPDAIIINSSFWMLPLIQRRKKRGENVRVIGICHADDDGYYRPLQYYRDCFDQILAVSETTYRTLLARGCAPERTARLTHGVECSDHYPIRSRARPLALVYVGRLVHAQKRILDFVPLIRALEESALDYSLDFFGEGEEKESLCARLAPLIAKKRIAFHGWVSARALKNIYARADIFLSLSDFEGMSLSLLEAMGHGVVPIVSRVASGVGELIQAGETGFTFPIADISTCAQLIRALDQNRAALNRVSRSAWAMTRENFSIEQHTQRLAEILNATMHQPPRQTFAAYMGLTARPFARFVPGKAIVTARRLFQRGDPNNQGYATFP